MSEILSVISTTVIDGKKDDIVELTQQALDEGRKAPEILDNGLMNGMEVVGVRDTVKIMVGGAPVTQAFADKIGANGYAANAPAATDLAKKFAAAA